MTKIRFDSIKKHGHSVCIAITKELDELHWKPGDTVKIEPNGNQIIITLVEAT